MPVALPRPRWLAAGASPPAVAAAAAAAVLARPAAPARRGLSVRLRVPAAGPGPRRSVGSCPGLRTAPVPAEWSPWPIGVAGAAAGASPDCGAAASALLLVPPPFAAPAPVALWWAVGGAGASAPCWSTPMG
eukprot:2657717-Alexandrium_andersonii.AAC.1